MGDRGRWRVAAHHGGRAVQMGPGLGSQGGRRGSEPQESQAACEAGTQARRCVHCPLVSSPLTTGASSAPLLAMSLQRVALALLPGVLLQWPHQPDPTFGPSGLHFLIFRKD